jgi:hypothetical protein
MDFITSTLMKQLMIILLIIYSLSLAIAQSNSTTPTPSPPVSNSTFFDYPNLVFGLNHLFQPVPSSISVCSSANDCETSLCMAYNINTTQWLVIVPFSEVNPCM